MSRWLKGGSSEQLLEEICKLVRNWYFIMNISLRFESLRNTRASFGTFAVDSCSVSGGFGTRG